MNSVYTDVLEICRCGHYAYTHQVRGSKPRGECYHIDQTGPCKCKGFVAKEVPSDVSELPGG